MTTRPQRLSFIRGIDVNSDGAKSEEYAEYFSNSFVFLFDQELASLGASVAKNIVHA
jgi:hypothetical protein